MTLSVPLSAEIEAKLRERAAASGKDLTTLVLEAVEEKLRVPQSLGEILAPVRAATRTSGMSEDELDALMEETRDEIYAEKQDGQKA